jgi:hypothetical protein
VIWFQTRNRREQLIRHLRGKRSLEIQHYLNAMCDWIGEREMRTENRRFQWFASIALSCLTTSHLRRQPLSDTEQHVPAHVCKVRLADKLGTTPFVETKPFNRTDPVKLPTSRLLARVVESPSRGITSAWPVIRPERNRATRSARCRCVPAPGLIRGRFFSEYSFRLRAGA